MVTVSGYANPVACAGCHAEIARTYRLTGMGRSFYRPDPERRVEDWQAKNTLRHTASDRAYTMLERDGKFFQRRHQVGADGKQANVLEYSIDYVVGSGNHARTYLHRNAAGSLVELPVSWYSEKGGYWAMSPGYDRPGQRDFRRTISDDCMFCHNGYPSSKKASGAGGEAVFGESLPEGIDCQRCHGPGQAHVDAAGSGRASKDKIVNPARLDRTRQLEVCMQCHLESTSRQLPSMIRRFNREPFSYRPSEPLGDYVLHFDHAEGSGREDKFEVAHAAYRLRKSACFAKSQMTCGTCHNPHQALRGAEAAKHFDSVCRSCHAPAHSGGMPAGAPAGSGCAGCHMPMRRTDDAVHVVMTDHYIQRRTPARDFLAALRETDAPTERPYVGKVVPYYPNPLADEFYLALAQIQHGADLEKGIPRFEELLQNRKPPEPEFYLELGKAYSRAGKKKDAIRWFEEALNRRAGFRPALKELGAALVGSGELARAAEVLEKAAGPPLDSAALTDLGNVYLRMGRLEDAERTLQSALTANPEEPEAHNLLGLKRLQAGDRTKAETEIREAIRLDPDLPSAHNNLANLLAGSKDYAQAKFHFEKAIAIQPAFGEAHHSYGLLLVLTQSYDRAFAELSKAVQLAPGNAEAHNDLGDVLVVRKRLPDAVEQYRLAVSLKSDFVEAHLALGQTLVKLGRAAEARPHFEKAAASSDPGVRAEAQRALR